MATFNGVANQNNTFNGADNVADRFNFAPADLNSLDTVKGGGGNVTDILALTTAGTVTAASLAKVSGIEQITLANSTNAITLTNAMVTSALGTRHKGDCDGRHRQRHDRRLRCNEGGEQAGHHGR